MLASLSDLKIMLGDTGVADAALTLALNDARRTVIKDGVAESHEDFSLLHRYKAAHMLTAQGHLQIVASESVGDVSRSFAANGSGSSATDSYQQKYRDLLVSIVGLSHKVK